jgi:hypothetical protein
MKKLFAICGALVPMRSAGALLCFSLAALAPTAVRAAGYVGLHVLDCHGSSALNNPCTHDLGYMVLVGSVISPNVIPLLQAMEASIDLSNGTTTLSPW